ncbi:aminodeoxychorismate lyase [Kangiella marina]|uniref:Aminodeoxychorismate lyase n=2 Tax=Kangiella marina TaxID=1079178 RepID=A0ABP8IB01_9GAMM
MVKAVVNGQDALSIDISDRGLLYGDGFFSTLRVREGKVEHWRLHVDRIRFSAAKLGFPEIDVTQIERDIEKLIAVQHEEQGAIRLTVTRGVGNRGYKAPDEPKVTHIVRWSSFPLSLASASKQGVELGLCQTNDSINTAIAGIKHLNRLPQVLAQNEIPENCFDGIMLAGKQIIGGSKTNIYFWLNDAWYTPSVTNAGVNGTVRRWLLSQQEHVKESQFGLEVLQQADYCMVTNALYGMIPVTKILQHRYDVSPDIKGLQEQYHEQAFVK